MQEAADGPVQSLVLDLGLRVIRQGGNSQGSAEMRELVAVASRLCGGGGGGGDPTVVKLAQQLVAEAGGA